ncbi:MAG: hypothetical protein QXR63_02150 [Candidatus Bathyarchaeia archaeon]
MERSEILFDFLNKSFDREQYKKLHWEGTFIDYLDIVRKNPSIACSAFRKIYNMILSYGYELIWDGKEKFLLTNKVKANRG